MLQLKRLLELFTDVAQDDEKAPLKSVTQPMSVGIYRSKRRRLRWMGGASAIHLCLPRFLLHERLSQLINDFKQRRAQIGTAIKEIITPREKRKTRERNKVRLHNHY